MRRIDFFGRYLHVQLERATCFAYAGDNDWHSDKRRMESILCQAQRGNRLERRFICSYSENGPMIDYILVDSAPVEGGGYKMSARLLWYNEEMEYLPIFQKEFPGFTLEQMDEVHYCEYKWYDATEAPYCY